MKICDKCLDQKTGTQEVHLVHEDLFFDLCDKHTFELITFLQTKEKKKRKVFQKKAA